MMDSKSPHTKVQEYRSIKIQISTTEIPIMSGRYLYYELAGGDRLAVLNSMVSGNSITTSPSEVHEINGAGGRRAYTAEQLADKYPCIVLLAPERCGERFLDSGSAFGGDL